MAGRLFARDDLPGGAAKRQAFVRVSRGDLRQGLGPGEAARAGWIWGRQARTSPALLPLGTRMWTVLRFDAGVDVLWSFGLGSGLGSSSASGLLSSSVLRPPSGFLCSTEAANDVLNERRGGGELVGGSGGGRFALGTCGDLETAAHLCPGVGGAGGGRLACGATMFGWMEDLQMDDSAVLELDRTGGIGDGRWGICDASPRVCKAAFAKAAPRIEGFRRPNGSALLAAAAEA